MLLYLQVISPTQLLKKKKTPKNYDNMNNLKLYQFRESC